MLNPHGGVGRPPKGAESIGRANVGGARTRSQLPSHHSSPLEKGWQGRAGRFGGRHRVSVELDVKGRPVAEDEDERHEGDRK